MSDTTQVGAGEPKATTTAGDAEPTNTGSDAGDAKASANPSATGKEEEAQAFDATLLDKVAGATPQPTEQTLSPEAQKQVDKWKNRIIEEEEDGEGQLFTLAHPKLPSWVKRILKNDKLIGETVDKPKSNIINILKQIPPMPRSKQVEVAKDITDMISDGMPEDKAIARALRLNQVETEAYKQGVNRGARAAPPEGEPTAFAPAGTKRYSDSAIKTGQALFGLTKADFEQYGKNI